MNEQRTQDALVEVVGDLHPGTHPRWVGRRDRASGDPGEVLVAVPSADRARLLVPVTRRGSAASLWRFSCSLSPKETVLRVGLAAALRTLGTRLLPDSILVPDPGARSLPRHLGELLGEPVQTSLGIGSLRANRKPVLGVFDRSGRCIAYAKVGHNSVSSDHVSGEAEALARVGAERFSSFRVPELIHFGDWNGMPLLVCGALPTAPRLTRSHRELPIVQMRELATRFSEGSTTLAELSLVGRLRSCVARASGPLGASLGERVEVLLESHGSEPVESTAWHGDFTPWNMAPARLLRRNVPVSIWDWERFDTGVAAGLDRVHWSVNVHVRSHGFSAEGIAHCARAAIGDGSPAGVPTSPTALVHLYLATIAARYLDAAGEPGGEVLLPAIEAVLGALELLEQSEGASRRTRAGTSSGRSSG